MAEYQGKMQQDGSLKLEKSYQKLSEENAHLAINLDYITKEELISAIQVLVNRINTLQGTKEGDDDFLKIEFTYDNNKNRL